MNSNENDCMNNVSAYRLNEYECLDFDFVGP